MRRSWCRERWKWSRVQLVGKLITQRVVGDLTHFFTFVLRYWAHHSHIKDADGTAFTSICPRWLF